MRDILADLERWNVEKEPTALATVIQTWGSSPRQPGAKMGLAANHRLTGSVSGGCVEGAVYEAGLEVLQTKTAQLLHFGVADETAWEVGLACGGSIDVFVQLLEATFFSAVSAALKAERPFAIATVVKGPESLLGNTLILQDDGSIAGQMGEPFAQPVVEAARGALANGQTQRQTFTLAEQSIEVFVEAVWPPPTLVIVGGVHIAIALASLAKTLGYTTILIDPRAAFGNEARFPHVDQLLHGWPDEALAQLSLTPSTAVAMLTHDPKLDDPALLAVLPSPAFYIGALGSPKTQEKRRARLQEAGLSEGQIGRLHGPIGLPLGARTPEEIALSVMAEIVAARNRVETHHGASLLTHK